MRGVVRGCEDDGWENSLEHSYDPLGTHNTKYREVDIPTK